ncbi:matrixin family metalloprotease [Patescibacteria group bacterium]|nr:matrixin family metalloprotease [Candidatus Falkowbacteria bacterium]MBU3906616.1 matrixin family metalloprotease [Patescibacteria group bacterium]MBU4015539.1 matrixin family metalloprotease [Patescibacteria group bacterium]MBU4026507.1 matrixin family metalloprotease [Patescibacteria group bacterium]MBU4073722.1 matrixin family metalloprotease [Patescibacteria group bacterium]
MKKILILAVLMLALLFSVSAVIAGKPDSKAGKAVNPTVEKNNEFSLPENAKEVAPGVFYLGESMDKGKVVEGYAFVHYAKGSKSAARPKPVVDDTVDMYKLLFKGIKWADTMQYEVNTTGSGLDDDAVRTALSASLETWDTAIIGDFELFNDDLLTTESGFDSGDRKNRVTWNDLGTSGTIAMNSFWFYRTTKEIVESDVVFNTAYVWSIDDVCANNAMDLQNIATHEFGHNGLADLYVSKSAELTMYGYSSNGETKKRTLGTGDIAGINELY